MLETIEAKLIALGAMLLILLGLFLWGHHVGASSVQAKWDKANASHAVAAITASESARATENRQTQDFAGITSGYLQATTHAYPSLADALPAAVADGDVQLRDHCPTAAGAGVPEATTRSRAADATATQALVDRVAAAIRIVRIGDAADERERLLGQQVTALQSVLRAEREK